jgi:hypothetical protein
MKVDKPATFHALLARGLARLDSDKTDSFAEGLNCPFQLVVTGLTCQMLRCLMRH